MAEKLTQEEYEEKHHRPYYKCKDSPTGVHHWVWDSSLCIWACQWCSRMVKQFGGEWDEKTYEHKGGRKSSTNSENK